MSCIKRHKSRPALRDVLSTRSLLALRHNTNPEVQVCGRGPGAGPYRPLRWAFYGLSRAGMPCPPGSNDPGTFETFQTNSDCFIQHSYDEEHHSESSQSCLIQKDLALRDAVCTDFSGATMIAIHTFKTCYR